MSGTSLDGVDAVMASLTKNRCTILATYYAPYSDSLKRDLLALHAPSANELEVSQTISIRLAELYAAAVHGVRGNSDRKICAIGCHGQTIRHRPDLGFTLQLNNPALLAELTGISVVSDFRSRDIAAGGQGAPLVPAFHQGLFSDPHIPRTIVNIGGISNLTSLPIDQKITGFDCGPGNLLLDAWCQRHTGQPYDKNGNWGSTGLLVQPLLDQCLKHPFFNLPPPKSTGREIFHLGWLEHILHDKNYRPQDVQFTLTELTARSISDAILKHQRTTQEVYVCGGGAHNRLLLERIQSHLPGMILSTTDTLGIPADWVEAVAFAWLAKQTFDGMPGNLPAVTGARGPRILGAIYPA